MKHFILATKNPNKVIEIQSALSSLTDWNFELQPENVPDVAETGSTFVENAVVKAVHASHYVDALTLGDDSGLCVDALNGRPGIYSARYAENVEARIRKLLGEMSGVPDPRRTASFACALALARRGEVIWTTEARVNGFIVHEPAGHNGFGYDPVFWMPDFNCTMAELPSKKKDEVSARGRALQQLAVFLNSL